MKIVVFGANGGTGTQVVAQALAAGHDVTAVARRPETITQKHPHLTVLKGDVLDPSTLDRAIQGQDAVVSVLGVTNGSPHHLHSQGVANIMQVMQRLNVTRLICLSASGLEPGPLWQRLIAKPMLWYFLGDHYKHLALMEQEVKASPMQWTLMRPPRLTDAPHTGHYNEAINSHLPKCWSLSRADLADSIVKHLNDPVTYRAIVEVAS